MTTPRRDRSAPRQSAHTERLRSAGLIPVQVWVRPDRRAEVMALDQRREVAPAARVIALAAD